MTTIPIAQRVATVLATTIIAAGLGALLGLFLSSGTTAVLSTTTCNVHVLQEAGFDPWTGEPRPRIAEVMCGEPPPARDVHMPSELVGRHGVPWATLLTMGTGLLGAAIGIWLLRQPAERADTGAT